MRTRTARFALAVALVAVLLTATDAAAADWSRCLSCRRLAAENAALRAENAALRTSNARLVSQNRALRVRVVDLKTQLGEQEAAHGQELANYEALVVTLLAQIEELEQGNR